MAAASIEVSGPDAERFARELYAALGRVLGPGETVAPVEVNRSAELVVAVIGLVFSGIGTAKTMWDWWQRRRPEGVRIKIMFADGTHVDLSGVDGEQLELVLQQQVTSGR